MASHEGEAGRHGGGKPKPGARKRRTKVRARKPSAEPRERKPGARAGRGEVRARKPVGEGRRQRRTPSREGTRAVAPTHAPAHATPANADVARALREMSLFLEMDEVPFKPRAYEKAAYAVAGLGRPVGELFAEGGLAALTHIPGVGRGIAERIGEQLEHGQMHDLEALRKATPVDVLAMTEVEGLGPKMVKALYDAIGVRSLDDLEAACRDGRVRPLPHFGEKSERKILDGIAFLRSAKGRLPIGEVIETALAMLARLRAVPGVERAEVAGSLRRQKETIGDVDFLVASGEPASIMDAFVRMPEVAHVYAHGPKKSMVRLRGGLDADLRVVRLESWGAALAYFTGSKAHNVALRRIAMGRKLKLNEYGLFRGRRRIAGATEEEVYRALGLAFVPPELREDTGEVEAARRGTLPVLVEPGDVRGDLQTQTSWTDGAASLEEMVEAARARGLEYVAITDHTRDLPMARGADEAKLRKQVKAIRALNARRPGIRVLTGAEVNIRRDGSLDIADDALAELDVVGVGIHAHFDLPRAEQTRRVLRAMDNPNVDILFHPTCRVLGRRPPIALDMDAVIAAAVRTGVALEVDAQPSRLDLGDEYVRKAVDAGARLVIDSDAHNVGDLRFVADFGVPVARRGWARRRNVLNTLRADDLLEALARRGSAAETRVPRSDVRPGA